MKKKKRLSGIERRWFVNNVGVIMLLVLACVLGVVLYMAAYYDTNLRSGLENRAKTTTDFFSNYIGQSYNEYYQSCIKFAKTFEDKDRLELQFISPGGKIVASSYGKFAGRSPSTPEIQQAIDSQQTRHYKGRNPLTGERILAVSSPMIYTNGEVIGVLRYVTSLRNADLQVLMIALIAVTVGLLFIGSIFFLSSFFIRSILVPVSQINATAKRIASGSYGVQIQRQFDDEIGELADYQALAQERNPLLNQVSLKRQLAEEGVRAQRADFLPQVAAMGGGMFYNYQVSGLVPRWAVGVGVHIKLFDGLNREYKYSAARQTVRRVGELQNKAGQDIAVLIEKLYNQLLNYRNQMASIDSSLAFAEEYLRMKNAAFLEGMSSSSDLIDAELNLAGVRAERLQAAYKFDLALARLLEAAGISEEFADYARRADARPIYFDKK